MAQRLTVRRPQQQRPEGAIDQGGHRPELALGLQPQRPDLYVERRDFMKFLVLTSAAFTVGQLSIAVQNWYRKRNGQPAMQRIASVDDLAVGGAVVFTYPDEHEPCLLVRLTTSEFVAFSQKCTHLSCAVIPRPAEGSFYCPCHEGRFDLRTGAPTAGPPRRPLTRVVLDIRGRDIYAVGIEERT